MSFKSFCCTSLTLGLLRVSIPIIILLNEDQNGIFQYLIKKKKSLMKSSVKNIFKIYKESVCNVNYREKVCLIQLKGRSDSFSIS